MSLIAATSAMAAFAVTALQPVKINAADTAWMQV
jgi:hypothetical protein